MSRPAISQHLKVLERAGFIERTTDAQWRRCTLRTEPLDEASAWVERHRDEWNERFDLLDERLREMKGRGRCLSRPPRQDKQFTITRVFDAPRELVWQRVDRSGRGGHLVAPARDRDAARVGAHRRALGRPLRATR